VVWAGDERGVTGYRLLDGKPAFSIACGANFTFQAWVRAVRVRAGIWWANGPAWMPPEIGSILNLGLADRANSIRTLR
jgi:hypothetical protein